LTVRRARREDAFQLAELAEATFRHTFASMNTPADLDLHCRTSYGEAIQANEIADRKRITLLSEHGERLVGFAQLRWGKAPICVTADAPAEIQRLYVIAQLHGTGVAQELMNACLTEMTMSGSDVAWLGVWEHNPKAVAFYTKFGFQQVGEHVFQLGNDAQRDVVMVRALALPR
jgi:ribosomal protein S18 acetylase RimI-like enzyme